MQSNTSAWQNLASISGERLFAARAQMHQAAQLLAAIGISFLKHRPDDSHTTMTWSAKDHVFMSQSFGQNEALRVSLNPISLDLKVLHNESAISTISMHGLTLNIAAKKLQSVLHAQGCSEDLFTMQKHYDLPDYPDRNEAAFDVSDSTAFKTISNSFANAFPLFLGIKSSDQRVSDLLIWPHHFDLGMLISVELDKQGGLTKSIGLGLSPGDGSYIAPYYYVTNWPAPTAEDLPGKLTSRGKWHTEHWVGLVLPLDRILQGEGEAEQQAIVSNYLDNALSIASTYSAL